MSAIDVAAATNTPIAASGKSKAGATKSDKGDFERIFESVGNKPSNHKNTSEKADKADKPHSDKEKIEAQTKDKAKPDNVDNDDAPASTTSATSADAGDLSADLVKLISGSANLTAQAPADNSGAEKAASTPLRRDILSHLSVTTNAEDNIQADPKAPRLTVIGRETHFAPVNTPQTGKVSEQAKASPPSVDVLLSGKEAPIDTAPQTDIAPHIDKDAKMGRLTPDNGLINKTPPVTATQGTPLPRTSTTRALPAGTNIPTPTTPSAKVTIPSVTEEMLPFEISGGMLAQVADQLITHARDLASASSSSATPQASAPNLPPEHQGGPVRILRLQLQPEELGMVTARLRIVGGVLELRLTADRQQSVEILQRDQDGLLESLRRAGYKAEIASIEFVRPGSGHQAMNQQQTNGGSGQSFAGSNGSGGFNDGSGHHAGEGHAQRQHTSNGHYADERLTEGLGDGSGRQQRDPQSVYL